MIVDAGRDAEQQLQIIRVRLGGRPRHLYAGRLVGQAVDEADCPGAERILSRSGRILLSTAPSMLTRVARAQGLVDASEALPMLTLDIRRAWRQLGQHPKAWSPVTRGTVVAFDDLLWDAAASIRDLDWMRAIRDTDGFHRLYAFVWGDVVDPGRPALRQAMWAAMVAALLRRSSIALHGR